MLKEIIAKPDQFRAIPRPHGRINLSAIPTATGIERPADRTYSWDGLKRGGTPFIVIQHTFAGAGRLNYEGQNIDLTPGKTMLVQIPHRHHYFLPSGSRWSFFFLILTGRESIRLATEILSLAGPALTMNANAIDTLADICNTLITTEKLPPGAASALAYRAITLLLDQSAEPHKPQSAIQPDWITPVLNQIEKQLHKPLQIEALREIAGMSRAHFVRQFKRQTGTAPSDYIFHRRMQRAAGLLQTGHLSIAEVAKTCGFQNPNYFTKAFRRAYDISPSEFRASGMYTNIINRST